MGPQGATGADGAEGPEGPIGPRGPQGNPGQPGLTYLGARVSADGSFTNGHGISEITVASKGQYNITFTRDISSCIATATSNAIAMRDFYTQRSMCQRRSKNASAGRSNNASGRAVGRRRWGGLAGYWVRLGVSRPAEGGRRCLAIDACSV